LALNSAPSSLTVSSASTARGSVVGEWLGSRVWVRELDRSNFRPERIARALDHRFSWGLTLDFPVTDLDPVSLLLLVVHALICRTGRMFGHSCEIGMAKATVLDY
jgi:hypothetical protein